MLVRNADKMDMIRHEAVSPDIQIVFGGILVEPMQVLGVIFRFHEDSLPVISPLRDMVRVINRYGSRYSGHGIIIGGWETACQ